MKKNLLKLAAGALLLGPACAMAHHSFSMFDMQKTVTLTASVTKFTWQNPHAWLEADARLPGGKSERWAIEMTSPNNLAQEGWKRSSLRPGDKVTLYVHPLRNGAKGGSLRGVRLATGATLGQVDQ
jgi:hypothetical protein